ncbi:hypothetical protein EPN95_04600 [Patescibacteria group bacterium]|nr:MAG: hypothetical protein EPN95_04600 [Patescibacteria group bacterium]
MSFLRKYAVGAGADIYIPIIKRAVVDFAVGADFTVAAGDVKISIDGAAAANIGTLPVALAMGNGAVWKFVFTNAELTGKYITVTVVDAATKAVEDQSFVIETYGNASALHPFDLGTANVTTGTNLDKTGYTLTAAEYAALVNLIFDELTAEARTAGSYGQLIKDNLNAAVGSRAIPGDLMGLVAGAITNLKFAAGAIDAAAIATDAFGALELAADAVNEIADGILDRNMGTGTDSGSPTVRTLRQAVRFLRNRWAIAAGTLTVYKEDDITASWTSTITTTAGNPVSESDPPNV